MSVAASGSLYGRRGQRKYLTSDERRRFLDAADRHPRPEIRTLCHVLALTGCRISEALALTGECIIIDDCVIVLRTLKRRRGIVAFREVPVPRSLIVMLVQVHELRRSSPSRRLWPLSRSRAWQLVKEVMDEAGIGPGVHASPKGLRHGFGVRAIQCAVPLTMVQKWMGHARLESTAVYLQVTGPEERRFAACMWSAV